MSNASRSSLSCSNDCDDNVLVGQRNDIYNAITGKIYDDRCCDLVKRAYSFWSQKLAIVVNRTVCVLTRYVRKCKITRREFEIRYALFQISVQKLNRLLVCALKRILKKDNKADRLYDHGTLGYNYGCFDDEYCENSTASAVVIALSNLRVLVAIALNLDLDRGTQECSIRLTLERTHEAFGISTSLEGCGDSGCGVRRYKHKGCKKGCGKY
uniref:Uncharacterized protein n=1 Tax=viral metagenome TaxID=1070528 RepID=A0A6C0IWZ5_9ZZZZ